MRYFARICAHARSWREFAKCRFAHFPSFFSVHVDTYDVISIINDGIYTQLCSDMSLYNGSNRLCMFVSH